MPAYRSKNYKYNIAPLLFTAAKAVVKWTRFTTTSHRFSIVVEPFKANKKVQVAFERKLCLWIVFSLQPFLVVEHKNFWDMMICVNVRLTVPGRTRVMGRILAMCKDSKLNVKSRLKKSMCKVSLTEDARSSRMYTGFIVVRAHWIDNDLNLKTVILEFARFKTPQTG